MIDGHVLTIVLVSLLCFAGGLMSRPKWIDRATRERGQHTGRLEGPPNGTDPKLVASVGSHGQADDHK